MIGCKKTHFNSAFTLVELIVVIVILAILATIAFLSFSSQSASARDSTRLADISNIAKGLSVFSAVASKLPMPDNKIDITASGMIIGYQGYAGASVLNMIKLSNGGKDPLDTSTYYTYSVNSSQNKFQILGFLEDGSNSTLSLSPDFAKSGLNETYAEPNSYTGRYAITRGDMLGILLDSTTKVPVQAANMNIDLKLGNASTIYNAVFGSENINANIVASGTAVFSNIINRSSDLIQNKAIISLDDNLVGYWDMETMTGGKLMDFSKYGNDGTLSGSVTVGGISGVKGKASSFDGVNDYIYGMIAGSTSFSSTTTSLWVKTSDTRISRHIIDCTQTNVIYLNRFDVGKIIGIWDGGSGENTSEQDSTTSINDGNWHFVVSSNNGTTSKVYIDGILESTYPEAFMIPTANNYGFGSNYPGTSFYSGSIDEIRTYNRALSEPEISNLYNATKL